MPNPVEGLLEVYEDVVEVLLVLEIFLTTKKEVRGVIGLLSFYRRYVPDLSTLVCPLTDLTKKDMPNKVV